MPRFEFDPRKSRLNWERHGIDFVQAQKLWEGTHVTIPAKHVAGEGRYLVLGRIAGKLYAAVFTLRNETIRLISCHRADRRLEKIYREKIHEKIH